jgi:hypothetical protein
MIVVNVGTLHSYCSNAIRMVCWECVVDVVDESSSVDTVDLGATEFRYGGG